MNVHHKDKEKTLLFISLIAEAGRISTRTMSMMGPEAAGSMAEEVSVSVAIVVGDGVSTSRIR